MSRYTAKTLGHNISQFIALAGGTMSPEFINTDILNQVNRRHNAVEIVVSNRQIHMKIPRAVAFSLITARSLRKYVS